MKPVVNANSIFLMAFNEFHRFIRHPLSMVISLILLVLALFNGIGGSRLLFQFSGNSGGDLFLEVGMSQIMYTSALFCTVMATFIGVTSITNERLKGSMNILLTKPLFRRDIVLGKFLGINAFMLAMVAANLFICSFLIVLFYRAPLSFEEYIIRLSTSIVLLFLECSLVIGITMLIGIAIKNTLISSIMAATYLYFDWYVSLTGYLGKLSVLSPSRLLFGVFLYNPGVRLLDTSIPYRDWLNTTSPYILFIILEIVAVLALNCIMLTRSDE